MVHATASTLHTRCDSRMLRLADLAASMVDLERQYESHQSQIYAVAGKAEAEASTRER